MADLSLLKFGTDIDALCRITDLNIADVVKKITLDLFARIVGNFPGHRHPVDTGRARAGWGISIDVAKAPDPPPAVQAKNFYPAPGQPDVRGVNGTQQVYILNAVEYIEALEDGHSKQAPAGMVKLAMMEVEAELEAFIATNTEP